MNNKNDNKIIAKYLGRVIGVLSNYTHSDDWMYNAPHNLLATFSILFVRAKRNGLQTNSYDDIFIADCLDRIELPEEDKIVLSQEEKSLLSFNWTLCGDGITAKKIIGGLKAKGITRQDIADKIGVSLPTVQRWADEKANPETVNMRKLIALYNDIV